MKLQEFISETLKAYIAGVKEAQEYALEQGAKVNPESRHLGDVKSLRVDSFSGEALQNVEFDVAVTSSEGSGTQGGVGIFVAAFGLGAQGKTDMSSSTVSRIKFAVPVALPVSPPAKKL